jgi:hypothetical protein
MKNFLRSPILIAALAVFATIAISSNFSFAQFDEASPSLETKLDKLIDAQTKLSDTLDKAFIQSTPAPANEPTPAAMVTTGSTTPPTGCGYDYVGLPSASTWKDAPWSMKFLSPSSTDNNIFIDLNGDGLIDHANSSTGFGTRYSTCIDLNNGHGWDRVYTCYGINNGNNTWTFYGDCANA